MNWIGRIVGVMLGWQMAGAVGAVVGYFVGHFFDHARAQFARDYSPKNREAVQRALFNSVFPLLGYMAKADGRVSEDEVQATEQMMTNMGLSGEMRAEAIRLFQAGASAEFDLTATMQTFMQGCGAYPDIKQLLLAYLTTLAMSDGQLHPAEEDILRTVAGQLGFSAAAFEQLLKMAKAQGHFHGQGGAYHASSNPQQELTLAYEALGVSQDVSDAQLKKAYRRLMSQYHPDKLQGQGVPDDMLKVATEKSQEIQTAYDLVKKSRSR